MPNQIMRIIVLATLLLPLAIAPIEAAKKSKKQLYTATGEASYYADKFNGRKTASGEKFSNKKLTGAHRTLPFGTKVRVTNIKNNKSVIVKINDRGPQKKSRIIDISKKAAKTIGIVADGCGKVKVEELP